MNSNIKPSGCRFMKWKLPHKSVVMAKVGTRVAHQLGVLVAVFVSMTPGLAPGSSKQVSMTLGLAPGSSKQVSADGQGEFCLFLAPDAIASGIGHIGWGYQISGTNTYVYGATENVRGNLYIPPGGDNGYWQRTGSRDKMLSDFSKALNKGNAYHDAGYYKQYRCTRVENSAVGSANNAATSTKNAGYFAAGNNCLDHAIAIGNAYGVQMSSQLSIGTRIYSYFPNRYFISLLNWERSKPIPSSQPKNLASVTNQVGL